MEKNLPTQKQLSGVALTGNEKLNFVLQWYEMEEVREALDDGIALDQLYFACKEREITKDTPANLNTLLNALEQLRIEIKYNQLTRETEVEGLPDRYSDSNSLNVLPAYLIDFFKSKGVRGFSKQSIEDYIVCVADINRYNPIVDYLCSGKWDGQDRITKLCDIMGITRPLYQTYVRKWLIQCVALGLNDSKTPIGADGILVLQGSQGSGKTSFFRTITPCRRWFVEGAAIDVKDKDTMINALGGWITELGELDGTLKKEQAALKAFITQTNDRIRLPYAKAPISEPRRTSFCGTVNQEDYLRDETGSRRFWTIPITEIDKKALFSLSSDFINQLWYQVYALYLQDNNGFRLTDEELKTVQEENKEFTVAMPFELEIKAKFNYNIPFDKWEWWKSAEIAQYYFNGQNAVQIGRVLNKVACEIAADLHISKCSITKTLRGQRMYLVPLKRTGSWVYDTSNTPNT